jgi:CheY-like chemotaxis protein
MTTILHIEDDEFLADAVKDAFEALGFRGTYVVATSISQARKLLCNAELAPPPDLVIADMHLPDGTGMDVVRAIRSQPSTIHVPIVILSGDPDTATVNRAYALGANSYVSKGTSRRSIAAIVGNLYEHWLKDALLPQVGGSSRTLLALRTSISLRARKTVLYMHLAETLGRPAGDFWMDLALREGNMANIISFLAAELGDREVPLDVLEAAEAAYHSEDIMLTELESREHAGHVDSAVVLQGLVSNLHVGVAAQMISHLFPVVPTAMTVMREVAASTLEEVATWIEAHCQEDELRARIAPLRADAARLRAAGEAHDMAQPASAPVTGSSV